MTNPPNDQRPVPGYPVRVHRRRRTTGTGVREQVIRCRLSDADYTRIQARAARAGLTVAGWLVLLGQDAALHRPSLSPDQLVDLTTALERLRRIGRAVNSITAAENSAHPVHDAQLNAALTRVQAAADSAQQILAQVEDVFAGSASTSGLQPDACLGGRRRPTGTARDRIVLARVSTTERHLLTTAAAREGLAVGAWLGLLAEAPYSDRPALLVEQYRAVELVRRAARQIGTNLKQIQAARDRARTSTPPQLTAVIGLVDELTRSSLYVRGVVASAGDVAA